MFLRKEITIRDVNKYLAPLVDELKQKHIKTSNPDFEKELQEIAGIGWKQVKNYRNHPNPGKAIGGNSVIKRFVEKQKSLDKWYSIRVMTLRSLLAIFLLIAVTGIVIGAHKSFSVTQKRFDEIVELKMKSSKFQNPFKKCKKEAGSKIVCPEGTYLFRKSEEE